MYAVKKKKKKKNYNIFFAVGSKRKRGRGGVMNEASLSLSLITQHIYCRFTTRWII
jgi:hypothetical protein